MADTTLPKKAIISDSVLFQQMAAEGVLLDMDSEQYFGLDDITLHIWQILSEDSDVDNLLSKLLAEYNVKEEVLKKDIITLLTQMQTDKLLTLEY